MDPGFSPIWIRAIKVRIRPLINLWDLNVGFEIMQAVEQGVGMDGGSWR